ncbi:hypothetical protein BJ742DRAFT_779978 [Cladochytrium replicatum]|nr:hypothetical protein BJ742DRAFT_779978 [Cladochytrium replicatum]
MSLPPELAASENHCRVAHSSPLDPPALQHRSKIEQGDFETDQFLSLGGIGYSRERLLEAERIVLRTLNWKRRAATTANFCSIFDTVDPQPLVRSMADYLTELLLRKSDGMVFCASEAAIGAAYMARYMAGLQPWTNVHSAIFHNDQMNPDYLTSLCDTIAKTLKKVTPPDVLHVKYSTEELLGASLDAMKYVNGNGLGA